MERYAVFADGVIEVDFAEGQRRNVRLHASHQLRPFVGHVWHVEGALDYEGGAFRIWKLCLLGDSVLKKRGIRVDELAVLVAHGDRLDAAVLEAAYALQPERAALCVEKFAAQMLVPMHCAS